MREAQRKELPFITKNKGPFIRQKVFVYPKSAREGELRTSHKLYLIVILYRRQNGVIDNNRATVDKSRTKTSEECS